MYVISSHYIHMFRRFYESYKLVSHSFSLMSWTYIFFISISKISWVEQYRMISGSINLKWVSWFHTHLFILFVQWLICSSRNYWNQTHCQALRDQLVKYFFDFFEIVYFWYETLFYYFHYYFGKLPENYEWIINDNKYQYYWFHGPQSNLLKNYHLTYKVPYYYYYYCYLHNNYSANW